MIRPSLSNVGVPPHAIPAAGSASSAYIGMFSCLTTQVILSDTHGFSARYELSCLGSYGLAGMTMLPRSSLGICEMNPSRLASVRKWCPIEPMTNTGEPAPCGCTCTVAEVGLEHAATRCWLVALCGTSAAVVSAAAAGAGASVVSISAPPLMS